MNKKLRTVITGTGSYIPDVVVNNDYFSGHFFYQPDGQNYPTSTEEIVEKFKEITGIEERRYASPDLMASTIGVKAAQLAIEDAGIDPETIDQIIVAHNYGDVIYGTLQTDILPSLAARIKHHLGIKNPACIAYDILFGCPGWIQGVIQSHAYINAGIAKRCLVIGTETLSRVVDKYDRDSMIFADGAGAAIVEGIETEEDTGILSFNVRTDSADEAFYLYSGCSYHPDANKKEIYIKMLGRKIYEYAIGNVPQAMQGALDKSGIDISVVKKVFLHQANEKMDFAIINRFFRLYKIREVDHDVMPMSIDKLGNSSVATVPTLFDLVRKRKLAKHELNKGDVIILASVGAGMHINAIVYRV